MTFGHPNTYLDGRSDKRHRTLVDLEFLEAQHVPRYWRAGAEVASIVAVAVALNDHVNVHARATTRKSELNQETAA